MTGRALISPHVYGREAVRQKLKHSQKMHFRYFFAVFELLSDSLTVIYVELHQCPLHHSILLTQERIWEIFAKKFWELAILKNELFLSRPFWIFFSKKKKKFFCFIPLKISPNLYGRMDGSKFWCFPWFPENSLLCVILRYTVYLKSLKLIFSLDLPNDTMDFDLQN